jgi:hypothetical protein
MGLFAPRLNIQPEAASVRTASGGALNGSRVVHQLQFFYDGPDARNNGLTRIERPAIVLCVNLAGKLMRRQPRPVLRQERQKATLLRRKLDGPTFLR